MELKFEGRWRTETGGPGSNRTFMELKLMFFTHSYQPIAGSNRTFMELK